MEVVLASVVLLVQLISISLPAAIAITFSEQVAITSDPGFHRLSSAIEGTDVVSGFSFGPRG